MLIRENALKRTNEIMIIPTRPFLLQILSKKDLHEITAEVIGCVSFSQQKCFSCLLLIFILCRKTCNMC